MRLEAPPPLRAVAAEAALAETARQTRPAGSQPVLGQLVLIGPRGATIAALGPEPVVLGREPGPAGIVLDGRQASRHHCRLDPLPGGGHRLVDLGSKNGVWIRERRVESAVLVPFDQIRVGEVLAVYLDAATDAAKVVALIDLGEPTTRVVRPGRLRDTVAEQLGTLELGLRNAEPREDELRRVHEDCLAALLRAGGWRSAVLALAVDGGLALAPLCTRGLGEGGSPPGALAAFLPTVRAALSSGRIERHPAAEADEAATLCVPMVSGAQSGRDDPRRSDGLPLPEDVRGALLLTGPAASADLAPGVDELLRALARRVAVQVANVRLRRRASMDLLTQLPNRGRIEQVLAHALQRARETGTGVGVTLLDVDDFKRVNDVHGHQRGDEVLAGVAGRLRASLRRSDAAGRWGGEEFLLVLADVDLQGAAVAAAKAVEAVGAAALSGLKVTVSGGVATYPLHGEDAAALLRAADVALYAAKRAGKDRLQVYHLGLEPPLAGRPGEETEAVRPRARRTGRAPRAWLQCDALAPTPISGRLTLGRSPTCDVVLPDALVSRRHAVVTAEPDGEWSVVDCSGNGTLVNGLAAVGRVRLRADDRLTIGPFDLLLRVAVDGAPLGGDAAPGGWAAANIEEVDVGAFLAALGAAGATGTLLVHDRGVAGHVEVRAGRCVDARLGPLDGDEALAALGRLERGLVSFSRAGGDTDVEAILAAAQRTGAVGPAPGPGAPRRPATTRPA